MRVARSHISLCFRLVSKARASPCQYKESLKGCPSLLYQESLLMRYSTHYRVTTKYSTNYVSIFPAHYNDCRPAGISWKVTHKTYGNSEVDHGAARGVETRGDGTSAGSVWGLGSYCSQGNVFSSCNALAVPRKLSECIFIDGRPLLRGRCK